MGRLGNRNSDAVRKSKAYKLVLHACTRKRDEFLCSGELIHPFAFIIFLTFSIHRAQVDRSLESLPG